VNRYAVIDCAGPILRRSRYDNIQRLQRERGREHNRPTIGKICRERSLYRSTLQGVLLFGSVQNEPHARLLVDVDVERDRAIGVLAGCAFVSTPSRIYASKFLSAYCENPDSDAIPAGINKALCTTERHLMLLCAATSSQAKLYRQNRAQQMGSSTTTCCSPCG
jgi:hypothetical protein